MFLVRQACNLLLSAPWGCLLGEGINKYLAEVPVRWIYHLRRVGLVFFLWWGVNSVIPLLRAGKMLV